MSGRSDDGHKELEASDFHELRALAWQIWQKGRLRFSQRHRLWELVKEGDAGQPKPPPVAPVPDSAYLGPNVAPYSCKPCGSEWLLGEHGRVRVPASCPFCGSALP